MGFIFRLLFFIFIAMLIFRLLKLIFQIGRTAGEFNRRADEVNGFKKTSDSGKRGEIIELDKNQYKVE